MHPITRLSDKALLDLCASIYPNGACRQQAEAAIRKELTRIRTTIALIPVPDGSEHAILDVGAGAMWLPAYRELGYSRIILLTKYRNTSQIPEGLITEWDRDHMVSIHYLDLNHASFPLATRSIRTVCCLELLEHLSTDPMLVVSEVNRVLVENGHLVLSTPNIACWQSIIKILRGNNPNNWSCYCTRAEVNEVRHHREYTPREVRRLVEGGGFHVEVLKTHSQAPHLSLRNHCKRCLAWLCIWLGGGSAKLRESHCFVRAARVRAVSDRYPAWLYQSFASGLPLGAEVNGSQEHADKHSCHAGV